eukprot:Nitzschia sp. Nitz4//scaffold128_size63911//33271//34285//NITZ4_006222-RA/size63911-snap-gene-0.59-mRNA-1//1//CDS//3329534841//4698//frame0
MIDDVAVQMTIILGTMLVGIAGLVALQELGPTGGTFLPTEPSKRAYEQFVMVYTPFWIFGFFCIVAFGWYEYFDKWSYMQVCVGLALPLLLQPILLPSAGFQSPDAKRPLWKRYAFKANVWLAMYSFIGNYWYTHCEFHTTGYAACHFYSVLKATYTMPAHRLNNVPLALFFATHFYFSTYHFFSNVLLRKIVTSYRPGLLRGVLFVSVVLCFSYFTAFMETLTISAYPDYSFEDRDMAMTVGSAFYGIYFIVSFPAFFYFDQHVDDPDRQDQALTVWDTLVSSCGYGMIILILLDVVRLYLDIPLVVGTSDLVCTTLDRAAAALS